jgi:Na+/melibiose symporter-like transporter
MLAAVPSVFMLAAIAFLAHYKLDERRFSLVRRALELFKKDPEAARDDFTQDEEKDLKLVTGHDVKDLWHIK